MLGLIKFKNPISWLKLYPVITGVYHGIIVGVLKPLGTLGLIIQYHGLSILIPRQHPTATSPDLGNPDGRWTKKNQQEKPGTGIALKMAVRRSTIRFWVTSFVSCLSMFMYSMILVCLQSVLVLPFCLKAEFCDSWVWSQLWSLFIELFSSLSKSCGHFFFGLKLLQNWENRITSFLACSYNHLTIQLHEVGPFHIWWWQIHTSHWPGGQWPFSTWMCT